MKKKIVGITGAAGYVGRRLIAHLVTQDWIESIITLDLRPVEPAPKVISHRVDITEQETVRAILAEHGVTHLVHAAFAINPPEGNETAMRFTNLDGSLSVIRAARNLVDHLTFISSVAVYGYRPGLPMPTPESAEVRPTMLYGKHKLEVERYLKQRIGNPFTTERPTIKSAVIRLAAVVGEHGAVHSQLRALTEQPFFVLSDGGKALTQAIHEDDAAHLISSVIQQDAEGVYNGAASDSASWSDVGRLTTLRNVSLPRFVLNSMTHLNGRLPALTGFTRDVVDLFSETLVVDNQLAQAKLGWRPRFGTCDAFYQMFRALNVARL